MSTNAFGQQLRREQPIGFHNNLLRVYPAFSSIGLSHGLFVGRKKGRMRTPLLSDPGPHLLAVMEGGQYPRARASFACLALAVECRSTRSALGGDGADRTPIYKTQRYLMAHRRSDRTVLPKHPIAGKGFWIRIILLPNLFHQVDRFVCALPDIERGQSEAAPPHLIQKANDPAWLRARPSHQPIACVFFNRSWGSGLVIQCLARFQLFPNLLRARRTLSPETRRGVSPCWKLIWAVKDNVHTLVLRPKSRGLRCSRSRSASNVSSGKVVRSRWGREEPSSKTASPAALKPWMMLRTVCLWQPHCLAIAVARSPRSDANRAWDRRKAKASLERKPAWIWLRSFSVKGRMNRGVFMPSIIPHCRSSFVSLH